MNKEAGLIVSVSGVRGVVGKSLTPEAINSFAAAFGAHVRGGPVVLARDGRPSGGMLREAVLAGLGSAGCHVTDIGVASTPTCGLAVRRLAAAGGVQITASHNPVEWNGLKLFGPDGAVLTAAEGRLVQDLLESTPSCRASAAMRVTPCPEAMAWHRDQVLEVVDVPRIRARKCKVFLDANGGAGGPLGRELLEALHCLGVYHACDPDGNFRHEPEPIAENLGEICPLVPGHAADVGFVLDPDADRLAVIDEAGCYIGEELTLALAAEFRLRQQRGPVVINMSTSRVVEDIARKHGCECHRSAVGEANVVAMMRQVSAVIGGEGNGGVIDPRVGYVRDAFIGMGLILNLMADRAGAINSLVDGLPRYFVVKEKYAVPLDRLPELFAALEARWPQAATNRLDGLRLDWPDRWVHVRASNTEPVVRVIAEASRRETAAELCREAGQLLVAR